MVAQIIIKNYEAFSFVLMPEASYIYRLKIYKSCDTSGVELTCNMPELTQEEFRSTFGSKMVDITENTEATVDIWPYVEQLGKEKIVSKYIADLTRVELVYRNIESTYDHAFLPTENQNIFLVIVVDLINENVLGHFWIDMEKEYVLKKEA